MPPSGLAVTIRPPFDARANAATAALDLAGVAHVDRAHLHPQRRRHGLDRAELAASGGDGGIPQHRRSRHTRCDLFEQLQPFSADAVFELHETGGVAARLRQALDEAGADRIGDTLQTRSARCGSPGATAPRLWLPVARMTSGASATNSAACLRRRSVSPADPATVDLHVAAVDPAQLRNSCRNAAMRACASGSSAGEVPEHADPPHPLALLRARRSGHAAAAPPSSVMNSRRFMCGWPPPGKR